MKVKNKKNYFEYMLLNCMHSVHDFVIDVRAFTAHTTRDLNIYIPCLLAYIPVLQPSYQGNKCLPSKTRQRGTYILF